MNSPPDNMLVLASIVLVEIAEDWDAHSNSGDSLRQVAEYLLQLSMPRRISALPQTLEPNSAGSM